MSLSKYVNGVAMFALLVISLVAILPALISAKDTTLVAAGFGYIAILLPTLYYWARKVFGSKA